MDLRLCVRPLAVCRIALVPGHVPGFTEQRNTHNIDMPASFYKYVQAEIKSGVNYRTLHQLRSRPRAAS